MEIHERQCFGGDHSRFFIALNAKNGMQDKPIRERQVKK